MLLPGVFKRCGIPITELAKAQASGRKKTKNAAEGGGAPPHEDQTAGTVKGQRKAANTGQDKGQKEGRDQESEKIMEELQNARYCKGLNYPRGLYKIFFPV